MPLLASIFAGVLYPPNWIFAFLPIKAASNILVITTFHISLTGCYLYARRIGINRCGSLITGIAFTFSAYLIVHLGHTSHIASAVWLPWIILSIEHLFHRFSWKWVSIGSFSIALQLFAGVPQMTLFTVITGGIYWLFAIVFRCSKSARLPFILASASMAVCGVLLSAIQLLPLRELQLQSPREKITYEFFSAYSLAPGQLLEIVFPFFFGGDTQPPFNVSFWGQWGFGETCGYVGTLTLFASLIALIGLRSHKLVWCWSLIAVIALLLSLGSYMPFGIHHLLFKVPVYNIFRASARHLYEFSFAASVLAGLGIDFIFRENFSRVRRVIAIASIISVSIFVAVSIAYKFAGHYLAVPEIARYENADDLSNAAVIFPWLFLIISIAGTIWCAHCRSTVSSGILVMVLLADMMVFGHVLVWKLITFDVNSRIADPPAVQLIKSRENNLGLFRVIGDGRFPYEGWPASDLYEKLNWPNLSILRGLQSVNGYDMLQPQRISLMAGMMTPEGMLTDREVFSLNHRGLDVLNVRYCLKERRKPLGASQGMAIGQTRFSEIPLAAEISPETTRSLLADGQFVDRLMLVTFMGNSVAIADGAPVMLITLHTQDGRLVEKQIVAGRDTAEWAYDRSDVRKSIRHQRPLIAESWAAEGFQGHTYLTEISFPHSEIDRITFKSLLPTRSPAALFIKYASLIDSDGNRTYPIDPSSLPAERWQRLKSFDTVDLLENLTAMPRAWFVSELKALTSKDVIQAIREGKLPDGSEFASDRTGLLELEDFGGRETNLPIAGETSQAKLQIAHYELNRIRIATSNPQTGFMVLSETWYRGWECWIDGHRAPVHRVNYNLRGIQVPSGDHQIEFVFQAHSFRNGATYSLAGCLILIGGFLASRRQRNKK
jgi:hypothetical protein